MNPDKPLRAQLLFLPAEIDMTTPKHEPTPAEIARVCAEYQKTWSPAEKRKRANGTRERKPIEVTRCEFPNDIYQKPFDRFP